MQRVAYSSCPCTVHYCVALQLNCHTKQVLYDISGKKKGSPVDFSIYRSTQYTRGSWERSWRVEARQYWNYFQHPRQHRNGFDMRPNIYFSRDHTGWSHDPTHYADTRSIHTWKDFLYSFLMRSQMHAFQIRHRTGIVRHAIQSSTRSRIFLLVLNFLSFCR